MRICFLVVLFLSFSLIKVNAQIRFRNPDGPLHFRINFDTKELWKEDKTGESSKVADLTFENVEIKDIPYNSNLFSLKNAEGTLLILDGTGQVFQLYKNSNKLIRLDKTFFRGYNFKALRFLRNDTLHSVGGTGFWHVNNIETYFSPKSKEWELNHAPPENGPKHIRTDFGGYDKLRDVISVIELPELYQNVIFNHAYRYFEKQIKDNKWVYKGDLNVDLLRKLGVLNFESTYLKGIYFFRNGPFVVLGDPIKNEMIQVEQLNHILNEQFELSEKNGFVYSYHEIKNSTTKEQLIKVDSISIAQLKSMGQYKGEFYVNSIAPKIYQIGAGITVLVFGFFLGYWVQKIRRKNSNISVNDSEFFGLEGLPEGAEDFLKAILAFSKGHQFSSQTFTELMGFSTYAYETQRQVRSKLIKAINSYFSVHYKMKSVIIRKTANDDRRFYSYSISEEYYEKLRELLGVS
jgi:hypothetical protein